MADVGLGTVLALGGLVAAGAILGSLFVFAMWMSALFRASPLTSGPTQIDLSQSSQLTELQSRLDRLEPKMDQLTKNQGEILDLLSVSR